MSGRSKLLGFGVTLLFLGLAFYRVDLGGLASALAAANYVFVGPALLCWSLGYLLRTARWRELLAEAATCRFTALFGVLMIGFATNNLLPARLGEVARAYLLQRHVSVRKTYMLASIFLERLFDGLVLVALLATLSLVIDLPGESRYVESIASVVFLAVAIGVAAVLVRGDLAEALLTLALRPFPHRLSHWVSSAFAAFVLGLSAMRRRSVLLRSALLSVLIWSLEWSAYFILSAGFDTGLSTTQRMAACALLLAVVNLGIMLPAAPGYVGTFQFFAALALAQFGIGRETALAFAIVAHFAQYVLVTAIGIVFLNREHVSLASLVAGPRSEPVETPGGPATRVTAERAPGEPAQRRAGERTPEAVASEGIG